MSTRPHLRKDEVDELYRIARRLGVVVDPLKLELPAGAGLEAVPFEPQELLESPVSEHRPATADELGHPEPELDRRRWYAENYRPRYRLWGPVEEGGLAPVLEGFELLVCLLLDVREGVMKLTIDQQTFDTDLAGLTSAISALIAAVNAKIAATPDLSTEDQAVLAATQTVSQELAAITPPAPAAPPASSPTAPPAVPDPTAPAA